MMFTRFIVAWAVALFGVSAAEARGFRLGQVPNGPHIGCLLCHKSAEGGDERNAFGETVESDFLHNGAVVWGPDLAALDSDGDGFTNGEELLDPAGTWQPGQDHPGDPAQASMPGSETSVPSARQTAIYQLSWAGLKISTRTLLQKHVDDE